MIKDMNRIQLPLTTVITWVGPIIIAFAGVTYTLTRTATTDHIKALKTQINAKKV